MEDQSIQLIRKLKYNGRKNIVISHSSPLISIALSDGNGVQHHFDDTVLSTALKPKQTLTYGEPVLLDNSDEALHISAFAHFILDEVRYNLSLEL